MTEYRMYLLDTNIVSYWMRGGPTIIGRLKERLPSDLALSAVTLAEIFYGIEKSAVKKEERRLKMEKIASLLSIFSFDRQAAESYGRIRAYLESDGTVVSERDIQIAAIALANRLTVVTHNVREFRRIEDLLIEEWAEL